uniref:ankyrin repeat and SOCS box protein 9-like n=1 Tax=Myxine glutinosa TaxID=7769 RepID=UPI00358F0312
MFVGANPHTSPLQSSVHLSAARGHTGCLMALLGAGVDPDKEARTGSNGDDENQIQSTNTQSTALYAAVVHGHPEAALVLLQAGASAHQGNGEESPLHAATRRALFSPCDLRLPAILLHFGADPRTEDAQGQRPVDLVPLYSTIYALLLPKGPQDLIQLCRLAIRCHLGWHRLNVLHTLPLPTLLIDFLLFRDCAKC